MPLSLFRFLCQVVDADHETLILHTGCHEGNVLDSWMDIKLVPVQTLRRERFGGPTAVGD